MKHLLLIAALSFAAFSSAFAENRVTKAENDAAMKAGRKELAARLSIFEKNVISRNNKAIESSAVEVLELMRKGMGQVGNAVNLEKGKSQEMAAKQYNNIEKVVHDYT